MKLLFTILFASLVLSPLAVAQTACAPGPGYPTMDQGVDLFDLDMGSGRGHGAINPCNGNLNLQVGSPVPFLVYNSQDSSNEWLIRPGWRFAIPAIRVSGSTLTAYETSNGSVFPLESIGNGRYRTVDRTLELSSFDASDIDNGVIKQYLPGGTEILEYSRRNAGYFHPKQLVTVEGKLIKRWTWHDNNTLGSILDSNGGGYNVFMQGSAIFFGQRGGAGFQAMFESNRVGLITADFHSIVLNFSGVSLTSIKVEETNLYSFTTLSNGTVQMITYPDKVTQTYAYLNDKTTVADSRGSSAKFEYDLSSSAPLLHYFTLDGAVTAFTRTPNSRVVSTMSGATTFQFDNSGNLTGKSNAFGSEAFGHDTLHNITYATITGNSGAALTTTYVYDNTSHRLKEIVDPAGRKDRFTVNEWGQPLTSDSKMGVHTTYVYIDGTGVIDTFGNQISPPMPILSTIRVTKGNKISLQSFEYFDDAGTVLKTIDTSDNSGYHARRQLDVLGKTDSVLACFPNNKCTSDEFLRDRFGDLKRHTRQLPNGSTESVDVNEVDGVYEKDYQVISGAGQVRNTSVQFDKNTGQLMNQSYNGTPVISNGISLY